MDQWPTNTIETCWYHNATSPSLAIKYRYSNEETSLIWSTTKLYQLSILPESLTMDIMSWHPITYISKTIKNPFHASTSNPNRTLNIPACLMQGIWIRQPPIKKKKKIILHQCKKTYYCPLDLKIEMEERSFVRFLRWVYLVWCVGRVYG